MPHKETLSLDEYIRHEQYKFIYTHPVHLKYGQVSGIFLACVNEKAKEDLKFSIRALLSMWFIMLAIFLGISLNNIYVDPMMLGAAGFISVFTLCLYFKDFIYTRKSLWSRLEKEFMKEKVNELQMEKISQALTSYQKSVFWLMLGTHKKNIDFNDIVNVVRETNEQINREKLIDILRK